MASYKMDRSRYYLCDMKETKRVNITLDRNIYNMIDSTCNEVKSTTQTDDTGYITHSFGKQ